MRSIHKNRELIERSRRERNFRGHKRRWFFLEAVRDLGFIARLLLKITFLEELGGRNAEELVLEEVEVPVPFLPKEFDGCRILFITDLHAERMDDIVDNVIGISSEIDWDYCIFGGDYTSSKLFDIKPAEDKIRTIVDSLKKRGRIFGVLGNHDEYKIAEMLESFGVEMLLNENVCLQKGAGKMYLVGVDDSFRYEADDIELAQEGIEAGGFEVLISHSPQLYKKADMGGVNLYLAGHTHGGQICLPGEIAVLRGAPIPRKMIKGLWKYNDVVGYTSRGCGISAVKARFFCPPEITLLTLRKEILID